MFALGWSGYKRWKGNSWNQGKSYRTSSGATCYNYWPNSSSATDRGSAFCSRALDQTSRCWGTRESYSFTLRVSPACPGVWTMMLDWPCAEQSSANPDDSDLTCERGRSSQRNREVRGVIVQTDVASLIHSPHFLSGILWGCLALTQLIRACECFVEFPLSCWHLTPVCHHSDVRLQFRLLINQWKVISQRHGGFRMKSSQVILHQVE